VDQEAFTKYLIKNRGRAWVGNPETLEVAKSMEDEGILKKDGMKDGTWLATQLASMPAEEMKKVVEAAMAPEEGDGT